MAGGMEVVVHRIRAFLRLLHAISELCDKGIGVVGCMSAVKFCGSYIFFLRPAGASGICIPLAQYYSLRSYWAKFLPHLPVLNP